MNELAQARLLAQLQVCSVISGATRVEHALSNTQAADWTLIAGDPEEVSAVLG